MINEFGSGTKTYGDLSFVTKNSKNTVKGLQFPLDISNTGGMFARNVDTEAIRDGLIQLIMTQNGERPMNYAYGTQVRAAVFEPLDDALVENLADSIRSAVERFEPRVLLRGVNVTPDIEDSRLDISVDFSIKGGVFSVQQINLTVDSQGARING